MDFCELKRIYPYYSRYSHQRERKNKPHQRQKKNKNKNSTHIHTKVRGKDRIIIFVQPKKSQKKWGFLSKRITLFFPTHMRLFPTLIHFISISNNVKYLSNEFSIIAFINNIVSKLKPGEFIHTHILQV